MEKKYMNRSDAGNSNKFSLSCSKVTKQFSSDKGEFFLLWGLYNITVELEDHL